LSGSIEILEEAMKRLALAAIAIGLLSTSAFSAPLFNQAGSVTVPALLTDVRIVCEENGTCYRPPSRHLAARWIYGDNAFYGPYDGPRYYGDPSRRFKWSIFSPWYW
jgi:hypothetical protein